MAPRRFLFALTNQAPAREPAVFRALTIAGSDSGAGAGIQADLKTFAAFGVYGTTAVTAVTAQNTLGVSDIHTVPVSSIAAQIEAVLTDIGAGAIKTGMLPTAECIRIVAATLRRFGAPNLVVDPVMIATSGDRLQDPVAMSAVIDDLLPLALIVTPNVHEAEALARVSITGEDDIHRAARIIAGYGPRYVLVKGGHLPGDPVDYLFDGTSVRPIESGARIRTKHVHGTGCTLSAAIAAGLARGLAVDEAVDEAKAYVTGALRAGFAIGAGHSPVHHFYGWWTPDGATPPALAGVSGYPDPVRERED